MALVEGQAVGAGASPNAPNVPCFKGAQILRYIICGLLMLCFAGALGSAIWFGANGDSLMKAGEWLDVGSGARQPAVCQVSGRSKMWVLDESMTWPEAESKCNWRGSHLVEIFDALHNEKVKSMCAGTKSNPTMCHIGLQKTKNEVWQWSTSQRTLGWKNWAPREPNNVDGKEDKGNILTQKGAEGLRIVVLVWAIVAVISSIIALIVGISASICVIQGLRQKSQCCVVSAAVTDGVCACCMICGALNAVRQPHMAVGGILSCLAGIPMVVASIVGCTQCGSVQPRHQGAPQQVTVVGQPVMGAQPVMGTIVGKAEPEQ